ncbi:MAG: MBL fold metallo-hydrolase [Chloroflexota bacterium]|nr:MBL fold metallo-hydrolase [Chloroflexota bacterium]
MSGGTALGHRAGYHHGMWQRILDGDLTIDVAGSVGPLNNNVYLLAAPSGGALAIDPAIGAQELLLAALRERGLTLVLILATHQHFDHIAEAGPLAAATGAPIVAHRLEAEIMGRGQHPLLFPELEVPPALVAQELVEGDTLALDAFVFQVLHTPGHTPGSICLYSPERALIFSGDTLFAGSYGRYDLPGGDSRLLRHSLRRLGALPAPTRVLPGHGAATTIGAETWLRDV